MSMRARAFNAAELAAAGIGAVDVVKLQRISRSLHRLDEAACNSELTARQETRGDNLEKLAANIANAYGRLSYHQSDPRGWSLYLVKPEELGDYDIGAVYNRGMAICSQ